MKIGQFREKQSKMTKKMHFSIQKSPKYIENRLYHFLGNNPMVGATVAVAVAVEEAMK